MDENTQNRIENAYQEIKKLYRKKGIAYSLYTFYRNLTCPIKRIFSLIPQGESYLDIGCGYGFISLWTALVFPKAQVTGFDLIKSRIEFARDLTSEVNNLQFQAKDITAEKIDDSQILLLIDLFHHIPFDKQLPFLKTCLEKTPENGTIIFKDIDTKPWWKFRVNYIQDFLFTGEKTYSRHHSEYLDFFKSNGFVVEYYDLKKGYPYSHYLIRATKEDNGIKQKYV